MQRDTTDKKPSVTDQFNEILFKHLKHLIGSEYGIGELSLNLVTISIITLLMERENEIESFSSDEIDRYTNETLLKDMEEMGFDDTQDMNIFMEDMIQKNYIHVDDDVLVPQKPTISMARLLDLIFPKMPGMNLIAYFIQTMDEVKSNRKNIDSATNQFDQTLHMQGIPLEKRALKHGASEVSSQSADKRHPGHKMERSSQNIDKISSSKDINASSVLGRKSADNLLDQSKDFSNKPKVLSSDAFDGKITKLIFGESESKEAEPDKIPSDEYENIEDEKLQVPGEVIEKSPLDAGQSQNPETEMTAVSLEEATTSDFDDHIQGGDNAAADIDQHDSIVSIEEVSHDLKSTDQDENDAYDDIDDDKDDDIEKRIMAFEEDLALECPLCRQSKVLTKSTATGKFYYTCSNKECSFISWSKPHHIFCPKCNNPFLIETSNKVGTINLKCPRATCSYWKKVPSDIPAIGKEQMDSAIQTSNESIPISQKPRRRVVRRRVVRRKR